MYVEGEFEEEVSVPAEEDFFNEYQPAIWLRDVLKGQSIITGAVCPPWKKAASLV